MFEKYLVPVMKKSVKSPGTMPLISFARNIISKGNGLKRKVVKGFGNAQEETTNGVLTSLFKYFNRPVIKGFANNDAAAQWVSTKTVNGVGRVRCFPIFNSRAMTRHVVLSNTPRVKVNGFVPQSNNVIQAAESGINSIGYKRIPKTPSSVLLHPNERTVVQGFHKTAANPTYKSMDAASSRCVVKGFC